MTTSCSKNAQEGPGISVAAYVLSQEKEFFERSSVARILMLRKPIERGLCYGVTTNREDSIEFDGLGQRRAGVGGSAAVGRDGFSPFEIFPLGLLKAVFHLSEYRRHDPLAPEPLDFHETSIEFDPTCDLVVVFPVPLQFGGENDDDERAY
ncbi:hypothetical protein TREMEDRAFT_64467 [Tremella mesenterica DSM 1558]|uniref:uncharacterized protein n=1 Tax=Tremella mesenterica (strain ATCC 24925 / CBS 8224 / DSM 1558 / NBRC 9311 / NRRL Y-6157 / RJB 2259-6 / UBC 559-6) TaxID=578456 RepID=UPI0003F49C86|nr:uncharacterized protein TREMEDRAFT_64467 [Tremella mesenterica DSM 1558]EIW67221.1 hypothetical protein TREMEDRAFT_64467 [Tremella mesenterica DSM 1558]